MATGRKAYSTEMDQDTARQLFEEGATLVFLDVPEGTEFGIDCNSWEVGPLFKGVKMIPPGFHFIYYSAVSMNSRDVAPRTGFFHTFSRREMLVKRWDPQVEDIKEEIVSQEEQERFKDNKMDLDKNLGAYPLDSFKKWMSMTNHISEELYRRLQPENGRVFAVTQLLSEKSTTQSRKEDAERQKMDVEPAERNQNPDFDPRLPDLQEIEGTKLRFTVIPDKKYPDNASPAEITRHNMDHSYVLESLLNTMYQNNPTELLGEIQFAFVCFLVGQVYDGFNQWKRLVTLMCSCETAISKWEDLYINFISMMHFHIKEIPEDFFVDIVSHDNFLVVVLHTFFDNLLNSEASEVLKSRGIKFRDNLQKRFMWDFTSEPDEFAPVVVDSPN